MPHDLDLEVPFTNWIVLGGAGSGKSSAACHLLMCFFKKKYSILYLNFKSGVGRTGPNNENELALLRCSLKATVSSSGVFPVRSSRSAVQLMLNGPVVCYAEIDAGPFLSNSADATAAWEALYKPLEDVKSVVVCFDEIINHLKDLDNDSPQVAAFRAALAGRANQDRTHKRFYVLIHQQLADLSHPVVPPESGKAPIPPRVESLGNDYSFLFAGKQLEEQNGPAFRELLRNADKEFRGREPELNCARFPSYLAEGECVMMVKTPGGLAKPIRIGVPRLFGKAELDQEVQLLKTPPVVWSD